MKSHMFFPFSVLSDGINSRCWEIDKKERNCSVPITVALTSFDSSTGSLLLGIGINKLIQKRGGEAKDEAYEIFKLFQDKSALSPSSSSKKTSS